MVFSLSNILKNHLQTMSESIHLGLGKEDKMYEVGLLYHYFTSPHQNYKQYDFGFDPLVKEKELSDYDAKRIKLFQIGIIASTSYLILEHIENKDQKEQDLLLLLDQSDLSNIISYFYQDIEFALTLISIFSHNHSFTQDELEEMQKNMDREKQKHLYELNPLLIGEKIEKQYQKRKH